MTDIEWCTNPDGSKGKTWNPVRGCARVSPGCDRCYAMGQARRTHGPGGAYEGLTIYRGPETSRPGVDWSGVARFVPEMLDEPLRWRKPQRVFVNSMSDLFHHSITFEQIAAVYGVMAACPQHTFMVLTKRPERAVEFYEWLDDEARLDDGDISYHVALSKSYRDVVGDGSDESADRAWGTAFHGMLDAWRPEREGPPWPLPNVHLGVSVESQDYVHRIAEILKCPAAVHWASLEPLLGPVDVSEYLHDSTCNELRRDERLDACTCSEPREVALGWGVAGTESGHRARRAELGWLESARDQFAFAGLPFFTKQIANERDKKGGDPKFWPGGPWPREYP